MFVLGRGTGWGGCSEKNTGLLKTGEDERDINQVGERGALGNGTMSSAMESQLSRGYFSLLPEEEQNLRESYI